MSHHVEDEDDLLIGWSAFNPLPKPDRLWTKGNGNTLGDDGPDKLWHAVGVALSSYEHLEEQLAELFQFFAESKSKAAARAYGVSNGRQNLLAEASAAFFDRRNGFIADIAEFKDLLKHYTYAASFRNEVAHGIVRKFRLNDEDAAEVWYLVAPSYNSKKTLLSENYTWGTYTIEDVASKYRYNADNVERRAQKCRALTKRFQYYYMEISQVYDHDVRTGYEKFPQVFIRPDQRRLRDEGGVPTKSNE